MLDANQMLLGPWGAEWVATVEHVAFMLETRYCTCIIVLLLRQTTPPEQAKIPHTLLRHSPSSFELRTLLCNFCLDLENHDVSLKVVMKSGPNAGFFWRRRVETSDSRCWI